MTNLLSQPLSGIRIIDLTSVLFGPYAAQYLGDLGAEVIKVEGPEGDIIRNVGPSNNPAMGAAFLGCNRNKKSVVLNLKSPAGSEALWHLIDSADAFMHNVRPQKVDKLGFSSRAVMKKKPDIVYAALHGYLDEGPYSGRPAYDDVIQGECGLAGAFAMRDGIPAFVPSVVADKSAGLVALSGILAALFQRFRSGKGVYMEVGMFESMSAYTLLEHQYGNTFVPSIGTAGYDRVISNQRKPFKTKDGYICMLAYTDKQWLAFWSICGEDKMQSDSRFSSMAARLENIDSLYEAVSNLLPNRVSDDWLNLLSKAEIPCGPVNTFDDLRNDPHMAEIDFFRSYQHPTEGKIEVVDSGLRFNGEPLPIREHAPQLGEHSYEVLSELGLSRKQIKEAARQS
jgi:crotonobetainyl-CoA:carnitine CoA-transferase CaiB-like acyl-CoA transferase